MAIPKNLGPLGRRATPEAKAAAGTAVNTAAHSALGANAVGQAAPVFRALAPVETAANIGSGILGAGTMAAMFGLKPMIALHKKLGKTQTVEKLENGIPSFQKLSRPPKKKRALAIGAMLDLR